MRSDSARVRFLIGIPLLIVGALVALYGLFAILYNDDGGDTSVTLAGHRIDADVVGAIALVFGFAALIAANFVLKGRSRAFRMRRL